MTAMMVKKLSAGLLLTLGLLALSCTRKDIEFGDSPENNYTTIVFIDTISVSLSSVITDSFETSGAGSLLLGKYKDPYLGTVSTKSFFQMTIPASVTEIPASAQYDSVCFIFHPNNNYYGDTTRSQTISVNELAQSVTYSYNSKLYNTSDVPVKLVPLGVKTGYISPTGDDSVIIRLNDTKGMELFTKLRQQSTDVTNADNFLNYFKGISLTTAANDTAAVYGLTNSMVMRVYYHTTLPYPESQYIDFSSLANSYMFNQVLANRSGTGLVAGNSAFTETPASQTNNLSYMQPGTGLYLKMIFPSLRSIISTDKIIKLLKAELIIRPAYQSFDKYKYKLPSELYLTQTDASNLSGSSVFDSTGTAVQYASPVTDDLYGENNYYRFNVTSYINQWLTTAGSEDDGFYIMDNSALSAMNVSRMIANNSVHGSQSSKLLLSVVIINK